MEDPISIITRRAAQYASIPGLAAYVAEASAQLSATEYGDKYPLAVAYLALHEIVQDSAAGNGGGQVVEAKVGQVERQYRAAKSENDDWSATKWGRALTELTRSSVMGSGLTY